LTTPNYEVDVYPFPHPELVTLDIVGMTGPYFFFGALMFNFVIQVGAIVSEKQNKLREILRVMGLKVCQYISKTPSFTSTLILSFDLMCMKFSFNCLRIFRFG
jgi:hypothetical protein